MPSENKVGEILSLLSSSGRPLSVPEIRKALGYGKVSSTVSKLWERGHLLASELRHLTTLEGNCGRWKWSRRR